VVIVVDINPQAHLEHHQVVACQHQTLLQICKVLHKSNAALNLCALLQAALLRK
jgi:hypothetical protein